MECVNTPHCNNRTFLSQLLEYELEGFGIRLNKEPPNITFRKKDKGGINLTCAVPQSELDLDLVKAILAESRIHNADIILRWLDRPGVLDLSIPSQSVDLIDIVKILYGLTLSQGCIGVRSTVLSNTDVRKRRFCYPTCSLVSILGRTRRLKIWSTWSRATGSTFLASTSWTKSTKSRFR